MILHIFSCVDDASLLPFPPYHNPAPHQALASSLCGRIGSTSRTSGRYAWPGFPNPITPLDIRILRHPGFRNAVCSASNSAPLDWTGAWAGGKGTRDATMSSLFRRKKSKDATGSQEAKQPDNRVSGHSPNPHESAGPFAYHSC